MKTLPCPFCGKPSKEYTLSHGMISLGCDDCSFEINGLPEIVQKNWNTRSSKEEINAKNYMVELSSEVTRLTRELSKHSWKKIETAPKDGTPVLVSGLIFDKPDKGKWVVIAYYHEGYWYDNDCMDKLYPPTHWMPLPETPKE